MKRICIVFALFLVVVFMQNNLLAQLSTMNYPASSGMFNDRGYKNSSNINISGEEIINNFNGNLTYRKTLFEIPGRAGFNLKIELVYNGSISHTSANTFFRPHQYIYNVSLPEWILSVNGIAVQVFNFENKAYNKDNTHSGDRSTWTASQLEVSTLVNGYHSCGCIGYMETPIEQDVVRLLMGDGSIQEMFKEVGGDWCGTYYSGSAGDFTLGRIDCLSGDPGERIFYLKPGDGTTITYEEYIPMYFDSLEASIANNDWKPKVFYPSSITDSMHNLIQFFYDSYPYDGHKILTQITMNGKTVDVNVTGNFNNNRFLFQEAEIIYNEQEYDLIPHSQSYLFSDRYVIEKIIDPEGRETCFTYTEQNTPFNYYKRKAKNLMLSDGQDFFYTETDSNKIYMPRNLEVFAQRINKIKYPDGRVSVFNYLDITSDDKTAGIDFEVPWGSGSIPLDYRPLIQSRAFIEYGRDPFFINMVEERKVYKDSLTLDKTQTFDFVWTHRGASASLGNYIKYFYFDQGSDFFTAVDTVISPAEDDTLAKKYYYRMYPYEKVAESYNGDNGYIIDSNYETKLTNVEENHSYGIYRWTKYEYDSTYSLASMLMTKKFVSYWDFFANHYGQHTYTNAYNYSRLGASNEKYVIGIVGATTTNPLGVSTKTVYIDQDGLTKFKNDSQYPLTAYSHYLNNLVDYEEIKINTTLLAKADYNYFTIDGDDDGFQWQLKEKLIYYDLTESPYKTSYKYYKDEWRGGHVKEVRDPYWSSADTNFHVIKYDYKIDGVSQIEFKKQFNNSCTTCCETVSNGNSFYLREKIYPSSGFALITDRNVDANGNTLTEVSPVIDGSDSVGYGVKYEYDKLNRVTKMINPYDFNTNQSQSFSTLYSYDDSPVNDDGDEVATEISQRLTTDATKLMRSHYYFDGLSQLMRSEHLKLSNDAYSDSITYNFLGEKIDDINANDHKTKYFYDEYRQLERIAYHPMGNDTTEIHYNYAYGIVSDFGISYPYQWPSSSGNNFNLRKTTTDENSNVTKEYYDALNQLRAIHKVVNGQDLYTYFDYNGLGNLTKVKDPEGYETSYEHDDLGRMTSKNSVDAGDVFYLYDKTNNLRFIRDANGIDQDHFIYYKYDGINRKIQEGIAGNVNNANFNEPNAEDFTFPDEGEDYEVKIVYVYDIDPQWFGISGGKNLAGRLSGVKYWDNTTNDWGYTAYSYDANGRIEWIRQALPGELGIKKIVYDYNSADLPTKISYNPDENDKFFTWYDYDEFAQIDSILASTTDSKAGATRVAKYEQYTPLGQIQRVVLGNNIQGVDYVYNEREWLTQINHQNLVYEDDPGLDGPGGSGVSINDRFGQIIGYNDDDHIASNSNFTFTPQYNGNISWHIASTNTADPCMTGYTFNYDETNRLKEADYGYWGSSTWNQKSSNGYDVRDISYNDNGNFSLLKRYNEDGVLSNLDYEYYTNSNKLKNIDGSTTSNYTYDSNGNLIGDLSKNITSINYDYRNLPYKIFWQNGGVIMYGYNANGNRVIKRVAFE
jgi:YD repeat-containing protein